ncbi:GNAT family N-acetyltransferase [Janibacter limosus]|uniref:GNAT family N-acetyltransferase n=1 Tax=Janibacter limosus TaxID=53458 RepID=UPI000830BEA9|nr:N-acetyltransferase [Janibacter limosus]
MRDDLIIRRESAADSAATEMLHDAAFGVPQGRRESVERELLRGLRADGSIIDELTFVAELENEIVGHVVCSRASIDDASSVGLGPIGVRPDHQQQGIGAALVMAVVASADRIAEPAIVLLGDPEYYGFFGFVPASGLGIGSPGAWEDTHFQALTLRAWRPEMAGAFRYAAAFDRLA